MSDQSVAGILLTLILGCIGVIMCIGGIIASFTGVGMVLGGPIAIIGYKLANACFDDANW